MLIGLEQYSYFINCTAVQLMIFSKQTKWRTGGIKKTKLFYRKQHCFRKIRTKHQILAKSLAGVEYDVYIENYRLEELNKAF